MCDVWKNEDREEWTAAQLARVLENRLFSRVRHVGLSGGEPSLRADLPEVVGAVLESLPRLQTISITTHGFLHARWKTLLPILQSLCRDRAVRFTLNVSVDGIGPWHDEVRGIPGAYESVMRTCGHAAELGVALGCQATVSKRNVHHVGRILHVLHGEKGLDVDIRIATEVARLNNTQSVLAEGLNAGQSSFLADFLRSEALHAATASPARRLFYRSLASMLAGAARRSAPCHYQREGVLLTPEGDLFQCSISRTPLGRVLTRDAEYVYFSPESEAIRQDLICGTCPSCPHDQSGAWSPFQLFREVMARHALGKAAAHLIQAARVAVGAARAIVCAGVVSLRGRRRVPITTTERVLCVGMYGGEHVGDAAILGGVLLRAHRDLGLRRAVVASFRPDRTQRWVDSLVVPVEVAVVPLRQTVSALEDMGAVLLAGGPIMDLPRTLSFELRVAAAARRRGIPFMIESVGFGPFRNPVSRVMARLLIRMADKVTARTRGSASAMCLTPGPMVVADPAFDYIESRRALVPARPKSSPGLARVGLNLRPLWYKYDARRLRGGERDGGFLEQIAEALTTFSRNSGRPVEFKFFPMNADQYGFSDLGVAYRLQSLLPDDVPLHIWESEPDPDELIEFMGTLDAVVAMRFHACVFGFACKVPTIGIDYACGEIGKVSELFADRDCAAMCRRMDLFTAKWLAGRLTVAVPPMDERASSARS